MGENSLVGRAGVCGAQGQEFKSLFSPLKWGAPLSSIESKKKLNCKFLDREIVIQVSLEPNEPNLDLFENEVQLNWISYLNRIKSILIRLIQV